MGFLDDLLGNTAADASKKAAADTYAKQQAATAGIQESGGRYRDMMTGLAGNYAPWTSTGSIANGAVHDLIADPSSVRNLPGYAFDMSQGVNALDHSAAANGSLFSGRQGKALTAFGQNLADKTYGDQLARLLGVSQQGLQATQQYNQTVGQGLTGELGANTSAYNGQLSSAGTIGQGDVAAANAKAQGAQGLLNIAANGIGSVLGSGGFGKASSYAKSGFNSLFGGGSPSGYGA